jgi:lauroyl/myristoyl acyltransferase
MLHSLWLLFVRLSNKFLNTTAAMMNTATTKLFALLAAAVIFVVCISSADAEGALLVCSMSTRPISLSRR